MLMSNNEYEYCSSHFYDSKGEDGKDMLQSLTSPVASNTSPSSNSNCSSAQHHPGMEHTSGTCSGSDSDLSPFDFQSTIHHMSAQMGNRFTLDTDYIDELASDLESRYWENKPPENWTSEDVWHWIFSWAGDRSVDVEEVQPLAYSNMTGQQLCGMSRNDFVNLNPKYGGHIFETLQQLSNQFREFRSSTSSMMQNQLQIHSNQTSPIQSSGSTVSVSSSGSNMVNHSGTGGSEFNFFPSLPSFDLLRSSCLDLDCQGSSPSSNASSASESDRDSISSSMTAVMERTASLSSNHHENNAATGMNGSGAGGLVGQGHHLILHHPSLSGSGVGSMSLDHHHHQMHPHHHHQQMISKQLSSSHHLLHPMHLSSVSSLPSSSVSSIASSTTSTSPGLLMSSVHPIKKVGRRGRPPKKDAKSRNRQGKGNGKLWEFIRDLLLDPITNPSFIRWERREDGIFKFVQSDKVAKLWGQRKQNPRMTYEKLSRAMRYYYKSQVLLPVFGRRLVYKFGPNATGWRERPHQVSASIQ